MANTEPSTSDCMKPVCLDRVTVQAQDITNIQDLIRAFLDCTPGFNETLDYFQGIFEKMRAEQIGCMCVESLRESIPADLVQYKDFDEEQRSFVSTTLKGWFGWTPFNTYLNSSAQVFYFEQGNESDVIGGINDSVNQRFKQRLDVSGDALIFGLMLKIFDKLRSIIDVSRKMVVVQLSKDDNFAIRGAAVKWSFQTVLRLLEEMEKTLFSPEGFTTQLVDIESQVFHELVHAYRQRHQLEMEAGFGGGDEHISQLAEFLYAPLWNDRRNACMLQNTQLLFDSQTKLSHYDIHFRDVSSKILICEAVKYLNIPAPKTLAEIQKFLKTLPALFACIPEKVRFNILKKYINLPVVECVSCAQSISKELVLCY